MFNNREAIAISDWEHRGFFYNSKSKNCVGALSLLRSVHTVSLLLKSNWSSDFGHAETKWSEKACGFAEQNFFNQILK